jgi:hypothetical protein
LIKDIYKKSAANIILNAERWSGSPYLQDKDRCPLSPFSSSTALNVLASAIRQEKELKDTGLERRK